MKLNLRPLIALTALALAAPAQAAQHQHLKPRELQSGSGHTLLYYGGPVISNAKIYAIWWGGAAGITSTVTTSPGGMGAFFEYILDSAFVDAWAQYNTNIAAEAGSAEGDAGTGQTIGRGNYAGAFALEPVPASNSITDAQVQTTLEAAVTAGTLPAPDANTIYAIFFPAAVKIDAGGESCSAYGAYHDQTVAQQLPYLVIPDCGYSYAEFTIVTSHEVAEAITDRVPTPGSNPDYPQAWNDDQGNEAADLCEGTHGTISTAVGPLSVQQIWDEGSQGCVTAAHEAVDFSIAIEPHSWSLAAASSTSVSLVTSTVAGAAQPLTLAVAAPAGVTATLSSSTLTSGDTATLTLTSATPITDAQVVVSAAPASSTAPVHSAALLLQVSSATDDFSLSLSPDAGTLPAGGKLTFTVSTAAVAGTSPNIALKTTGLPSGVTAAFAPAAVSAGASSTLTLSALASVQGTHEFNVVGTGDVTHSASASFTISEPVQSDAGTSGASDGGASDAGGSTDAGTVAKSSTSSGCGQTAPSDLALPALFLLLAGSQIRRRSNA